MALYLLSKLHAPSFGSLGRLELTFSKLSWRWLILPKPLNRIAIPRLLLKQVGLSKNTDKPQGCKLSNLLLHVGGHPGHRSPTATLGASLCAFRLGRARTLAHRHSVYYQSWSWKRGEPVTCILGSHSVLHPSVPF